MMQRHSFKQWRQLFKSLGFGGYTERAAWSVKHRLGQQTTQTYFRVQVLEMQVLVDQLREKCLEERHDGTPHKSYTSLSQAHEEYELETTRPCGGERLLLMFDR